MRKTKTARSSDRGARAASPANILKIPSWETERRNRGDRIRTCDLLVPNQALYQAKLRPVLRRGTMRRNGRRARKSAGHGFFPGDGVRNTDLSSKKSVASSLVFRGGPILANPLLR